MKYGSELYGTVRKQKRIEVESRRLRSRAIEGEAKRGKRTND